MFSTFTSCRNVGLDALLLYIKMGEYNTQHGLNCLNCSISCASESTNVLFAFTAALQIVSHQTHMNVEQRTDEANWFRKIGTETFSVLVNSCHFYLT